MQGMVPLSGFGGVPYSAVRKAAPRNILDNSDFTNLVAQAGIGGNHGTIAYAADRWILDSGTVSYAAGVGLTLNGTIRQKLEFPPTGETSAFVGMASGEASISYADGAVTITSSGGVLKWAALYGGVYTETTKPEYQPKGYGAELAECQRYYQIIRLYRHLSTNYDNEYRYYGYSLPVKMRAKPAVTIEYMDEYKVNSFDKNSLTSYSGESYSNFEGMAISFMCKSEFGTVLSQCYVSTKIACTADL